MAELPYSVDQVIANAKYLVDKRNRTGIPWYSQGSGKYVGPRGTYMEAPAFDCSSFIGTINGVSSCPATQEMARPGNVYTQPPFNYTLMSYTLNLEEGDILIRNRGDKPNDGHTALYIGNGECIHCTGDGGNGRHGGPQYISLGASGIWNNILRNPNRGIRIIKWERTAGNIPNFSQ